MNAAARKEHARETRLNRWAERVGTALAVLSASTIVLGVLGTMWFCIALVFTA